MNVYGKNINISVYGSSRGAGVVVSVDGLPAGVELDMDAAWYSALRRGLDAAEPREGDSPLVVSGMHEGATDGSGISVLLPMHDDALLTVNAPRPGHEDLALMARGGFAAGGAYSGRIAMAIAFAGALCLQLLEQCGVRVYAQLIKIGTASGDMADFDMKRELLDARGTGDSVGSVVRCVIDGLPAGLGSPVFGGFDSRLASLLFAIPGVKGVEFGLGFRFAELRGSVANDQIALREGVPAVQTNNAGGVEAGYTTGEAVIVNVAIKPNPSMGREQRSVDMDTMREVSLRLRGRHEPCLGMAELAAVEGAAAICALDILMEAREANCPEAHVDEETSERSDNET